MIQSPTHRLVVDKATATCTVEGATGGARVPMHVGSGVGKVKQGALLTGASDISCPSLSSQSLVPTSAEYSVPLFAFESIV